ncbi:MAG: single-stranded DNA-binding protein [Planctomycetota bacterium]|nr:MAG: single-stranded DNA-binding protein [Planctomycetota bacterium]
MSSFNRVILMGNITRDPELRYIPSGMAVSDVTVAVNDKRKNAKGEWVEETTFVDVTLWGRTAEVANEYLSKGSPIFIEGRLKLDQWEADGQKKYKLRVVCERMQMIGGRGGGQGPRGGGSRPAQQYDDSEAGSPDSGFSDEYSQPAGRGAPAGGPPADDIPF